MNVNHADSVALLPIGWGIKQAPGQPDRRQYKGGQGEGGLDAGSQAQEPPRVGEAVQAAGWPGGKGCVHRQKIAPFPGTKSLCGGAVQRAWLLAG